MLGNNSALFGMFKNEFLNIIWI